FEGLHVYWFAYFFFSSRRRHTRSKRDWSSDVCSSDLEVADLGFGKCRFALAALKGTDIFQGYRTRTIASKYMNVAKSFFEGKNMDVDLVKIEGSVELAPVLGLADAIVDIVETGTTLRANGLEVIEDICQVSARMIV